MTIVEIRNLNCLTLFNKIISLEAIIIFLILPENIWVNNIVELIAKAKFALLSAYPKNAKKIIKKVGNELLYIFPNMK